MLAIGFENYRIFDKETIINLKPITILTGPNSSGKSSVIKAMKLMKQNATVVRISDTDGFRYNSVLSLLKTNGGVCQTPFKLSFLPDEYGHYLRSYESILNETNFKEKGQDSLSMIFSIEIGALAENFFGKLTFGTVSKSDMSAKRIGFTLLIKEGKTFKEVIHLQECSSGYFFGIRVNYSMIKKIFEKSFLPLAMGFKELISIPKKMKQNNIDEYDIKRFLKDIFMLTERDINNYSRNSDTYVDELLEAEKWLHYDKTKPILPFYQILMFETEQQKEDFLLSDWYINNHELFESAKKRHNDALGFDITQILNLEQKRKVFSHFKKIELSLFRYMSETKLGLPFDQMNEEDFSQLWQGIVLDNTFIVNDEDQRLVTSNKTENTLLEFEPFKELLLMHQSRFIKGKKIFHRYDETNNEVINLFIRRLASSSVFNFGNSIYRFNFFDPNRIEQALFYHSTNAPFAFKILSDTRVKFQSGSEDIYDFITSKLRLLNVADSFEINKNELGIFTIYLTKNESKRPLAEFGYGITKIFFLLLAIQSGKFQTIFIEEPEANLHPDLQSKLADIIVETQKLPMTQFVIETHSEYFIRKLQYLVAKNEVDKDQVLINYFNPASLRDKEGVIREIRILKDGSLSEDFGPGFFDEALNWKFELLKLKNLN